jgi:hypothetical protein
MIVFGLLSSVFDILTFLTLRLGFHASATLSRSGWFIESTITELAVMLVLRTNRPLLPKPPRPCCHPSPSPPSRSPCPTARWPDHSASPPSRPGSWPPSPGSPRSASSPTRGQTSLPLTTRSQTPRRPWAHRQHTTRPAAISVYQPGRPPPAAGMPERAGARPAAPAGPPEPVHLLAAGGAPDRARAGKLGQGCLPRVVR